MGLMKRKNKQEAKVTMQPRKLTFGQVKNPPVDVMFFADGTIQFLQNNLIINVEGRTLEMIAQSKAIIYRQ
jgi:hypothetical protein